MANPAAWRTLVFDDFADGTLTQFSLVQDIRGIGPFLQGRLNQVGIHNIRDLCTYFNHRTVPFIRDALTRLCQNARASQCVETGGPRANAFVAANGSNRDPRYIVRDVNMRGSVVLRAVLDYARQVANRDNFGRDRIVIPALPAAAVFSGPEASYCPCNKSQATCDQFDTGCAWVPNPGARRNRRHLNGNCVPQTEAVGFEGAGGFAGQVSHGVPPPRRPGSRYLDDWRVSGPVPVLGPPAPIPPRRSARRRLPGG
jgi:hypothetical protein